MSDSFSKNIFEIKDELKGINRYKVNDNNEHNKSIQSTRSFLKATNDKKIIYSELSRNLESALSELQKKKLFTNKIIFFAKQYIGEKKYQVKNKSKIISYEFNYEFYSQNSIDLSKGINEFMKFLFNKNNDNKSLKGLYKSSGVILLNLKLEDEIGNDLFKNNQNYLENQKISVDTVNQIRNKYNFDAIGLASSLLANKKRNTEKEQINLNDNYEYGLPFKFLGEIRG